MYVSLIFVFANFPDVEQSGYSRFFDRETIFLCRRNVGNQFYQFSPNTFPKLGGQKAQDNNKTIWQASTSSNLLSLRWCRQPLWLVCPGCLRSSLSLSLYISHIDHHGQWSWWLKPNLFACLTRLLIRCYFHRCHLQANLGEGRNYTIRWFFDMEYGGCSR